MTSISPEKVLLTVPNSSQYGPVADQIIIRSGTFTTANVGTLVTGTLNGQTVNGLTFVTTTGTQTISGTKTFSDLNATSFNGSPISGSFVTTGTAQVISGTKTFSVPQIFGNYQIQPMAQVVTTNAAPTTIGTISTTTGYVYLITNRIVLGIGTGSTGNIKQSVMCKNVGGALTVSGIYDQFTALDAALAGTSASWVVSGTNLNLTVTGLVANTIKWNGVIDFVSAPYS